jgi:hypothetical protein
MGIMCKTEREQGFKIIKFKLSNSVGSIEDDIPRGLGPRIQNHCVFFQSFSEPPSVLIIISRIGLV